MRRTITLEPGQSVCLIDEATVREFKDWTLVEAVRLEQVDEDTAQLVVTRDLDLLTGPEGPA
jgi:hypothetical protein